MATLLSEWTKEEERYIICFFWAKAFQPAEIHRELMTVWGLGVMAMQHGREWCREFGNVWVSVAVEQRNWRPSTPVMHVEDVDSALQEDRHVSLVQLEQRLYLSYGIIWDIVYECLDYREVCSRWVPRQLADDHKMARRATSLALFQQYVGEG
jgi:hypothetical protein